MDRNRLQYLYHRYIHELCSEEEIRELKAYLGSSDQNEDIEGLLDETWNQVNEGEKDIPEAKAEIIYQKIISEPQTKNADRPWLRIAASIALLVSVGLGLFLFYNSKEALVQPSIKLSQKPDVVLPGGNKAVLTLADGSKIILNESDNGKLTTQENVEINKVKDGLLVYSVINHNNPEAIQLNTISTPRGGQYQISLPDGTKVWLNAASSLKFPTMFTGKERLVEITGEAYFEVAHNKKMPFKVIANAVEVVVLGTHFNVMAYADESSINTTLLEGSVKVTGPTADYALLKPAQQAQLNNKTNNLHVAFVNTEEVVAWKNGYFIFKNENVESIMRKIARWYDVEIEYKGNVRNKTFGGTISRFENVSEILKIMELTGVIHFNLEGRRIMVMP